MFINALTNSPNLRVQRQSTQGVSPRQAYMSTPNVDQVSFSGKGANPEVLKNQLRILLTQDIFATSLKVKMPETPLEKEVLLEVLHRREKLDRLTRLTNDRMQLKTLISRFNRLYEESPSHPELPELAKKLEQRGNLESVFKTLEKDIEMEKKKHKPSVEYFENLIKLEDEYFENGLIKASAMEKFMHKMRKNNINPDGNTSTRRIIEIVSGESPAPIAKPAKAAQPPTKKQVIAKIQEQYELLLRQNVDVYAGEPNHNHIAKAARQRISQDNLPIINRYGLEKQLHKIYETAEHKYTHKIDRLDGVDIYPIGEIWKQMKPVEAEMKQVTKELAELRNKLAQAPDSAEIKTAIAAKEQQLAENKAEWIKGLTYSVDYEKINRARMIDAGRVAEYDYLTAENATINQHKAVFEAFEKNNYQIPEDLWAKIIA